MTASIRPFLRLLAALSALCAAAPLSAHDSPFPKIMTWVVPQATIMARDFPPVDDCAPLQQAYAAQGWPKGISPISLDTIDKRLKQRVFLRPDQGPDTWTPLAATVIDAKRRPAADCDDVAVTGAQLAVCAGFLPDRLGLLVTQLPTRAGELHLVAFYADPQSGVRVFADTMGRPRAFSALGQKLHSYAFLDALDEWWALRDPRSGKPLADTIGTASLPQTDTPVDLSQGSCPDLQP